LAFVGGLLVSAEAESAAPQPAPPTANPASVTSTGQRGGVTARDIQQLNQTILPSLVRGPQLEKLKALFVEGAKLKRAFDQPMTNERVEQLVAASEQWANNTYAWLREHVSEYAAERFAYRQPQGRMIYTLPGVTKEGYADAWGNQMRMTSDLLFNLDQLMRDPSIYPSDLK